MSERWQNGLCANICGGDCGTCLASWCCQCFLYGRAAQRLDIYPSTDPAQLQTFDKHCGFYFFAGWLIPFSFHWFVMAMKREELRERFNIEGHLCRDILVACCCTPCGNAQMNTELKRRAENAQAKAPIVGYPVQTQGMIYQPPEQQQPHVQQRLAIQAHPHEMDHQQPEQEQPRVQEKDTIQAHPQEVVHQQPEQQQPHVREELALPAHPQETLHQQPEQQPHALEQGRIHQQPEQQPHALEQGTIHQ